VRLPGAGTLRPMPIFQHDYGVPSEEELAQMVGAATPHFAFQIRSRVERYAERLPAGHPRSEELRGHLARLERLGFEGEDAPGRRHDLPPRPSLTGPEAARG
jgi:hypothetical protein